MRIARSAFRDVTATSELHDVPATFQRLLHLPYPLLLDSTSPLAANVAGDTVANAPYDTRSHGTRHSAPRTDLARYTFAMAAPDVVVRARGQQVDVVDLANGTTVRHSGRALDIVRTVDIARRAREATTHEAHDTTRDTESTLPPFQGGWAGYIGYEYGGVLERIPEIVPNAATDHDDVVLAHYPWTIAWDRQERRVWIVGIDEHTVQAAYELLQVDVSREQHTGQPPVQPDVPNKRQGREDDSLDPSIFPTSLPRPRYEAAVEAIKRYIAAGDVFQVNLSQQLSATIETHPWTLYRYLRDINPAPFAAYFDAGPSVIVSVSPERFLKASADGRVETRPIKGTRPRGVTPTDDARLHNELRQSTKDAAEHVMIVDVLRNDIARVSTFGSVEVPELMVIETHPTVHHLVSTITSQLRPDADAMDLLHASFPGGSITGAPKVRAMEIIAELEPVRRGVYCGTIGYISHTGAMDTNIAIRTCVLTPQPRLHATEQDTPTWHVTFSAGGGVVFDSVPAAEYDESIDKARALMRAVWTMQPRHAFTADRQAGTTP